jgi:spore germination protein
VLPPPRAGRLGVIIFDQKIAEHGVLRFIDNFQRDANIGRDIHLVFTDESSFDILNNKYVESNSVPQYIIDVVDQNLDRTLPNVTFHQFLFQYYAKGFDPFMLRKRWTGLDQKRKYKKTRTHSGEKNYQKGH